MGWGSLMESGFVRFGFVGMPTHPHHLISDRIWSVCRDVVCAARTSLRQHPHDSCSRRFKPVSINSMVMKASPKHSVVDLSHLVHP